MKIIYQVTVCLLISLLSFSGYASKCPTVLRGLTRTNVVDKVLWGHAVSRDEAIQEFVELHRELDKAGVKTPVIVTQTVYLTKAPLDEVLKFFKDFPDTGLKETEAAHAVLVQTAFMSKRNPQDVIEEYNNIPAVERYATPVARAMILQTAIFAGVDVSVVIDFIYKAKKTPYNTKGLTQSLIIQAAFLLEKSVSQVVADMRSFPYVPIKTQNAALDVLKQTLLYSK